MKRFSQISVVMLHAAIEKYLKTEKKQFDCRAVVVAQLVVQLLPTPEGRGSNPVIGKLCMVHLLTVSCIVKTKIMKKWPGMGHFLKNNSTLIKVRTTLPRRSFKLQLQASFTRTLENAYAHAFSNKA